MGLGRYADFVYIALAIGGVFGALYLYTGVWPPLVTVESNSMMHVNPDEYAGGNGTAMGEGVGFGRLGTVDPGDLVLLHEVDGRDDVETFAHGTEPSYGRPGDVIAFGANPPTRPGNITVIHRAMTHVEIRDTGEEVRYVVEWTDEWDEPEEADCARSPEHRCVFGPEGVSIPEIGVFQRPFERSGFITKGDNVVSNPGADQAGTGTEQTALREKPVLPAEIQGRAQGELPALGLLKLAFSGDAVLNADMQSHQYFLRIGNMVAPVDLWLVAGGELVAISVAPFVWTVGRNVWRGRETETVDELSVLADAHAEAARRRPEPEPGDG